MPDIWVVMATIRPMEALRMTKLVLGTPANLAIAVDGRPDIFNQLKEIQKDVPDRFILELDKYAGQVDAVNRVYGYVRELDPSNNILFVPIPDDMPPQEGWYEAFQECYQQFPVVKTGVGVLSGDDGRSRCAMAGFAGTTAKFCDLYQKGWLHCPDYIHFFLDHELTDRAKILNCYYVCPSAKAWHEMTDHGKNVASNIFQRDGKRLAKRRTSNYPYDDIPEAPWRFWK